jgi:multiple sugar transport system substrate-binding protein
MSTAATLDVALISGPMYDDLYDRLPAFEQAAGVAVRIGFRGSHPQLNAHLAGFAADAPYDLVSTHTKYAPSQKHLLAPVHGVDTAGFYPSLLDLATIDGALYAVPRNIDVRLLHYRTGALAAPPATWEDLVAVAKSLSRPPDFYGLVFTGMESGLFGTFFELAEGGGARLFPAGLVAEVNNEGGRWALGILRELYSSGAVPPEVAGWHYDEVHQFFRNGRAAMVCDWPGYYGSYRDNSPVSGSFRLARMPAALAGRRVAYAGSHTFALTRRGAARPEAVELLRFLTAPEQQSLEAARGSVPVRQSVMAAQQAAASGADAERWRLLGQVIETDLIVPPKIACYPAIEEILWSTVRSAMTGEMPIPAALAEIEERIARCVAESPTNHAA